MSSYVSFFPMSPPFGGFWTNTFRAINKGRVVHLFLVICTGDSHCKRCIFVAVFPNFPGFLSFWNPRKAIIFHFEVQKFKEFLAQRPEVSLWDYHGKRRFRSKLGCKLGYFFRCFYAVSHPKSYQGMLFRWLLKDSKGFDGETDLLFVL